ncbi:carbohydrate ABC transporter permease [Fodinicola acaciae]|uniref:carbohydrate ABC transporter permease n=1 Tax=Fodinicola acaciae TaxID=2681555 RepID=UPI0013D5D98E|nr:carbohydrate ABC transporter permease [Fodinicola acaciae]
MARPQNNYLGVTSARKAVSATLVYLVLAAIALVFAAPLLWVVLASIDPGAQLSVAWPAHPSFDNFAAVLTVDTTLRPMANGLLMCGLSAILTMVVSVLAAYPLSRYQLRFNRPFLYIILFSTGLPVTAVMVPVYSLFVQLNLLDSLVGTAIFLSATQLPFSIWLTKGFMDGVPISLEEAAWVDGAGGLQALRSVVIPLMLPGMAVVAIFTFIMSWGNFFVPFILLLDPNKQPAAVSIFNFFSQQGQVQYGQLAAYSLLYSIPVVVLYIVVSRTLGGAFTLSGAVKG